MCVCVCVCVCVCWFVFCSHLLTDVLVYGNISQAYCFFGQEVLAEEKCGEAIRIMRHAKAC